MLRATGDRTRALASDPLLDARIGLVASVAVGRLRRLSNDAVKGIGGDKFALALVPSFEDGGGRRAAENPWVDEAGEADVGNVSGGAEDTFEVPDCLCTRSGGVSRWLMGTKRRNGAVSLRFGVEIVEETAAIFTGKYTSKSPRVVLEWLDVLDLDN